ncbi:MAG: adenylate/guanylate cyclase domain-containing protein [Pseudomonadota bacterium]
MEERTGRAVLLADITGSTTLYESVGDDEAARRVFMCIDFMREQIEHNDGVFVSAKGDDVLATFEDCDAALAAAESILAGLPNCGLSVHAGLHYGPLVSTRGDIFGDTVNMTARLASTANPGEALISGDLSALLSPERARGLSRISTIVFKGKSQPVEVFSLNRDKNVAGIHSTTVELFTPQQDRTQVTVTYGHERFVAEDGATFTIGRAPDNDLVIPMPWVSRRHATIAVADGRVQFVDSSSYGSYLILADAVEVAVHREATLLAGSGRISPGMSFSQPKAAVISFNVSAVSGADADLPSPGLATNLG